MCFDDSDDDLGIEDEDPYDPLYEPEAGLLNNSQIIETKKLKHSGPSSPSGAGQFLVNHCTWTNRR